MVQPSLRKDLQNSDHKYSRGVVCVAAGSTEYPGAAILTVGGARQGGAGYVTFLTRDEALENLVISRFPDVVPIQNLNIQRCDCFVTGPGGAKPDELPSLVPVVLDSASLELVKQKRRGITVITPHIGELKYLGETSVPNQDEDRRRVAERLSRQYNVTVVLKGRHTVIASPSSDTRVDLIGGPELATAGTGDILAGLIGSMLAHAKPTSSDDAHSVICRAVELHSRAGRFAAEKFTVVTALEILDSLRYV